MTALKTATLILEDGTQFKGLSFGADKSCSGEVVFNTGMTGYPESLTDPSYLGQIIVSTYPIVGNYGVPERATSEDTLSEYLESECIHPNAIVCQDYSFEFSHWQAATSLADWLKEEGGLQKMYERNLEKAKLLYDVIDASNGFYHVHGQKEYRSFMNVSFRLPTEELDKKFQADAKEYNLTSLGGHRSVGGERASIYNAMPREGVVALRDFMIDFMKKNA